MEGEILKKYIIIKWSTAPEGISESTLPNNCHLWLLLDEKLTININYIVPGTTQATKLKIIIEKKRE
jgi:hypothetical protein